MVAEAEAERFRMALEVIADLESYRSDLAINVARRALRGCPRALTFTYEQVMVDGAGEGVALGEPSPPAAGGAPPRAAEDGASGARVEAGSPIPGRNGADAPTSTGGAGSSPSARAPKARPRVTVADDDDPIRAGHGSRPHNQELFERALRTLGQATIGDIARVIGTKADRLRAMTQDLERDGTIAVVGTRPRPPGSPPGRGFRIYALKADADKQTAARAGTRGRGGAHLDGGAPQREADVLACIREGAGIDEAEIAAQLGMEREHVAEATGALLEAGRVALHPDGTYTEEAS